MSYVFKQADRRIYNIPYLEEKDRCFYLFDYIPRGKWHSSLGNQAIINFKRDKSSKDDQRVWYYRNKEIKKFARAIHAFIEYAKILNPVIIPLPTSKPRSSPNFNDRLDATIRQLKIINPHYDTRLCLDRRSEQTPVSCRGIRDVDIIMQTSYIADKKPIAPDRQVILIDDVLTKGTHFKAYKCMVMEHYKISSDDIIGLFIAKTSATEIEEINLDELLKS